MARSKAPSGSLRAHASTAEKARSGGVFSSYKPEKPKWKKNEFVGDDSGSSSSSSDSGSDSDDSDIEKEAVSDFKKRVSQTPSSKAKATPVKATPVKSPTVNGLTASVRKAAAGKKIKKEETSSSSASAESGSDSDSSSEEEDTKVSAKGKQVKQTKQVKTQPKPESSSDESEASNESESESESDHAKKTKAKTEKKPVAKPKASAKPVKKETTSESESSSKESESESEDGSEDADNQIAQQFKNDVQSAKTAKAQVPASSESKAKDTKATKAAKAVKAAKSPSPEEEDDSDVEMVDQSTALTNGGSPTKVGSVPEFVAPDFHLRKLDGNIDATDVAGFFEKAKMDGKQVWYITAPASLPVTVVQDLTIPMDEAQKGMPVLSHDGDDYRLAFDNPAASSSFRLLIPNKNGDEYSMLERPVNQTMHFTRSETFPADGPASIVTTKTIATTKPARPQPEGLKNRYTPLGVPSPKPTLAPPTNSKKRNAAAQETAATSSKKKRKHGNDGENGPAATTPTHQMETPSKNINAEKPAKKQKTSKTVQEKAPVAQSAHKETPVPLPLPPQANGVSSAKKPRATKAKVPSASQPTPASRRSASPGAALPSTQVSVKQTPVPIPFPKGAHVMDLTGSASASGSASDTKKERKKKGKKEDTPKKAKQAKQPEKGSFDEALANITTPNKITPILPPRFGGK